MVTALASLGLGAIVSAIVAGLFSKKKLGAEATKIITDAAAGVVTQMQDRLNRAEQREAAAERRLEEVEEAHARERDAWWDALTLHAAWDTVINAKLRDLGVTDLPEPPPLRPPRYTRAD